MIEVRPQNNATTYGYLDVLPHVGDLITLDVAWLVRATERVRKLVAINERIAKSDA